MCRIRDKVIRGAFSMYAHAPFPNSDMSLQLLFWELLIEDDSGWSYSSGGMWTKRV